LITGGASLVSIARSFTLGLAKPILAFKPDPTSRYVPVFTNKIASTHAF